MTIRSYAMMSVTLALLLAGWARGATVKFWLSPNDDGFGNGGAASTPGMFAIYADVSLDNGGLFAFGVDLADGPIDFIANLAPQGQFRRTGSPTKFVGFGAGVTEDAAAGKVSGLPDLAKGTNLIPAYGFGQVGGDLNSLKPSSYGNYVDTNPNAPGSVYNAHLLLAVGAYHGPASELRWATSVDNKASVYDDCSGTESIVAQLTLISVVLGEGPSFSESAAYSPEAVGSCAVPEPSTILPILSASVGLIFRTRRSKRG
ncbi:MAG TPA: PEP-CTERM sorting domain-containing protein [Tepidisphaeraceae bacterium]|jgi:hypothetical protein|nr:PEP-CTERM sorting domain-containing protein [Tepidisphaeraceae bacterium]